MILDSTCCKMAIECSDGISVRFSDIDDIPDGISVSFSNIDDIPDGISVSFSDTDDIPDGISVSFRDIDVRCNDAEGILVASSDVLVLAYPKGGNFTRFAV